MAQSSQATLLQTIESILKNTGLAGSGNAILSNARQYGVNPAFALAMFRKEASFAAANTRADRNKNPGNIIATGNCRGLPADSSCLGAYGEISTDGRFGKYPSMAAGIQAYFTLLFNEYKPGAHYNCRDLDCIIPIYAPASENDVELYKSQIRKWTIDYQCQMTQPINQPVSVNSNTMLIMDCSGSMAEEDENEMVKIEAARKAATNLINVIESENEAIGAGGSHQVGLVRFSTDASVVSAITRDTTAVRNGLSSLTPSAATGMADGLKAGMDLYSAGQKDKPIIILLSDGMPNIPLGGAGSSTSSSDLQSRAKQDVLDLAAQAGQQGICLYTVGFGDPSQTGSLAWIDEDYLRSVAQASGCGQYFNARDANQLTNVFISMRHISMGNLLMDKSGDITQGQTLPLGNVDVSEGQEQALITLNWPGSRLEPQITDPTGITVGESYPGASIKTYTGLKSISINKPRAGRWLVNVFGAEVPSGRTAFHLVFSTRGSLAALPAVSALPADNSLLMLGILLIFILAGAIYASTRSRQGGVTTGRMRGPHLDGLSGLMQGRQIPLSARLLIGRRSDCQLILEDMSVSRRHASIWFDRGSWYIDDLHSSGGTFVNQRQVTRHVLREGDMIRIGDSTFIFHRG